VFLQPLNAACLLQPVIFKVDYKVEAIGNKEFGSVFVEGPGGNENIAVSVVSNGWAKVTALNTCSNSLPA
jgi:staphylococcal nuclease domain-containing protein 1